MIQRPLASQGREPGKTRVCHRHGSCIRMRSTEWDTVGASCMNAFLVPQLPNIFMIDGGHATGCTVATRVPGFPFWCVPPHQWSPGNKLLVPPTKSRSSGNSLPPSGVVSSHPGFFNIPWQEPAEPQKHPIVSLGHVPVPQVEAGAAQDPWGVETEAGSPGCHGHEGVVYPQCTVSHGGSGDGPGSGVVLPH